MKVLSLLLNKLHSAKHDPLYLNSLFMMVSMAVVSASGFLFWMICARLYTPEQIGLATAIISVMLFLMNLSIVGFNYSLIRFLPKSKDKSQLVSNSFVIISVMGALLTGVFFAFLPFFSPQLVFLREQPLTMLVFVIFTILTSLDFATESIFMALRSAKYILLKNIVVSALKLILPFFFIGLGAFGIFTSWALTLSSAIFVSTYILLKKCKLTFTVGFNKPVLKEMLSFSFINYLVGLLGIAPSLTLPVLITNFMGATTAAYYYFPMMIANLLYVIPMSTSQSLFAEGSYDEKQFFVSMKKAFKLIGTLMLPAIALLVLFGNYILLFFGKEYSQEGIQFLQILAVSGIPVALNYIGLTFLNVHRRLRALLIINALGTGTILALSYLLRSYSLQGIGIAWLVGEAVMNVLYTGYIATLISGSPKKALAFLVPGGKGEK